MTALRCLLVLLLALAPLRDDEIVKEFRQYFRKYKDTPTRVEAVLALEGSESPAVVGALTEVIEKAEPDVVRAAVRVLGGFRTRPPVDALLAALEGARREPVQCALLEAVAAGRYEGSSGALQALLGNKSWELRRRAAEGLAAVGEPGAAEAILPLVADAEPAVRSAALEGLARLKSPLVLPPAIAALRDPVWQVRASAIAALKRVRHRDSIGPLIERMALEEGRLVADIADALTEVTGRNFGQRLESWRSFWSTFSDRFEIPSDEELARTRAKQRESAERYTPPGTVSYHGVETPSRSIVFVIDVSGSMEALVVETERFEGGSYPSMMRIDIVKTELARTLENLEPFVRFNVLAFATDVKRWKKELVPANVLNKSSAVDWVRRLEAIGGSTKVDLARAGLVAAANLEAGKTNTHSALMAALQAGPEVKGDAYEVDVDTIFFLSDGRPSHGDYVDPDDILREVRQANALRKVVIHTIAIGEFQKDFMEILALQNGGIFVDLGR